MNLVNHLEYNTERLPVFIPEYGRHLQKMVDYAIATKDREERNKIAKAIVGVMGNLQPHLRDVPDFQHKLWDQLFIMSDFTLDVDSPFPVLSKAVLQQRPEPLTYPQNHPKYRFYGNNIKRMIDVAITWEKGDMREGLEYAIANHMKKCYLNWNKDTVADEVIFAHLKELSQGEIDLAPQGEALTDSDRLQDKSGKISNGSKTKRNTKKRY